MTRITIDVVSDTVCPWCFIGKRRLEAALAARPEVNADVRWRAYQLNPDMPAEGMDRKAYVAAKFGSDERARALYEAVRTAGTTAGLDFQFDRIERAPNTLASHRLIRWAGSAGCQDAVVEALFAAYFFDGRDLGEKSVLVDVARQAGMDAALVGDLLDQDRDVELVTQEVATARDMGITGVPCFIFDGKTAVQGAQDTDVLVQVIDQLTGQEAPAAG